MNSTNQAQKRLKLLQIHFAVDIALFDVSISKQDQTSSSEICQLKLRWIRLSGLDGNEQKMDTEMDS
ncbi:hypothetical protein T06_13116 [Trichinella sp. T6]|nr:hypothetical protein T06_13116 [Trichinella sp. T6]